MQALKYSRQREAIKEFLMSRKDHPTADTVYLNIKEQYPNISLGTVYRNLSLLAEIGEIMKISTGTGADRFDGNPAPHYHFVCTDCQNVMDLEVNKIKSIEEFVAPGFTGQISGHVTYFYGLCPNCLNEK